MNYSRGDVLNEIEPFNETRCFVEGKVKKDGDFWNIRKTVGKEHFKETMGIFIRKDDKREWIARVPTGKCTTGDIKVGDCAYIQSMDPNTLKRSILLNQKGLVSRLNPDGTVVVLNKRMQDYTDSEFTRKNVFFPVHDGFDVKKDLAWKPTREAGIENFIDEWKNDINEYLNGIDPEQWKKDWKASNGKCWLVSHEDRNK